MITDNPSVGQLEDEAHKRKERLKALKRKASVTTERSTDSLSSVKEELPKPKFRSYRPQDESLREAKIPDAKPEDVESLVVEQLEAAKQRVVLDELDVTTLAPRKPDWDLKRDIASKLEILEKRTQRAIAELIRDRLKASGDLAAAVSAPDAEIED